MVAQALDGINVESIALMKRRELQQLCKRCGIKGNLKNAELISQLQKLATTSSSPKKLMSAKKASPRKSLSTSASHAPIPNNGANDITARQIAILNENTGDDFTDQLMREINQKAIGQPMAEVNTDNNTCKIPRLKPLFTATGVTVVNKVSNTPKQPMFSAQHQRHFDRLDSIDVYLEKKKRRIERMRASNAITSKIVSESKLGMNRMREEHNTPKAPAVKKVVIVNPSPLRPVPSKRNNSIAVTNLGRVKTRSKVVDKPSLIRGKSLCQMTAALKSSNSTSAINSRRSMKHKSSNTSICDKSLTQPPEKSNPRKSNKFNFGDTSICGNTSVTKAKPVFDLQASLKKRLSYKPYKGKIPVAKENSTATKRLDLKAVNVATTNITCMRGQRREKAMKNRKKEKENNFNARRGIV